MIKPDQLQSRSKVLGAPGKNTHKIGHLWKMPCVSLLLCLYHTVLVTALPLPLPSNVESTCNDSGWEGPFKSTLHWGWRGDARICGVLRKCPKIFGQDCTIENFTSSSKSFWCIRVASFPIILQRVFYLNCATHCKTHAALNKNNNNK